MHLCPDCGGAWLSAGLDAVRKRKPVGTRSRIVAKVFWAGIALGSFSVAPYFLRAAALAASDVTGYAWVLGFIFGCVGIGAIGIGWQAGVMFFREREQSGT
jgi:hypothetical protein